MLLKDFKSFAVKLKKEAQYNLDIVLMIQDVTVSVGISFDNVPKCENLGLLKLVMHEDDFKKKDAELLGEIIGAISGYVGTHIEALKSTDGD